MNRLRTALVAAIEGAGFTVSGPTDHRAAEHGEPVWVCDAREALADSFTRADPAVLRHMEEHGSGFSSALAVAWSRADSNNSARLMAAFGDLYARYAAGDRY